MPGLRKMSRPYPIVGSPWWAIDLSIGVVLIDADVAERFACSSFGSTGAKSGLPYATVFLENRNRSLHRAVYGAVEPGVQIDHQNRDRLDCRRSNLRVASRSQNLANRGAQANNTSGFKGVRREKRTGRWVGRIGGIHGSLHLGTFDTPEAAARAYDKAARERWGEYACCNFSEAA